MPDGVQLAILGAVGVVLAAVLGGAGLHSVSEGHVGLYWRGGALLKEVAEPGFHLKLPLVTSFAQVQVTLQTDQVQSIPCGTAGGVLVTFDRVEVVNRLKPELARETVANYSVHYDRLWIFDRVHHEINQFCSSHTLQEVYISMFDQLDERIAESLQQGCDAMAPGVEIIAVRVTKPRLPESLLRNYELVEAERTKLLIARETQKVVEAEQETERKKATISAQKVADVSRINMAREIEEKEASQRVAAIEDEMHVSRERAIADAESYKLEAEAEANKARLSPEFLEWQRINALATSSKVYFGESIPSMYVDRTSALPTGEQ